MSKLSTFIRTHFSLSGKKKFLAATVAVAAVAATTAYPQYTGVIESIRNITLGYLAAESTVDVVRAVTNR